MKKLFFCLFIGLTFVACNDKTMFSEFYTMPLSGWDADSLITFNVEVQDTINAYDIIIDVRHTIAYPYQNMWLFVNNDSIDFYLANRRGQWLGNGSGELREMPVLYKSNIRFKSCGTYTYVVQQGMRNKNLQGIRDIGLIVEKHNP
mgnify:CR=1 FL=1